MKPSTFPKILCAVLFLIMIGWAPQSVFAQHGGHGGGGGWHGGGGGWHGGSGGGWHGGGGGWHGGGYYGGWGHSYWGYPGWGSGWGFSIGFNWGPFWGGYGYPYGYGWSYPYYPYYYSYPYPYPYDVSADDPPGYAASYSSYGPYGSNGYAYSSRPPSNAYANDSGTQVSRPPAPDRAPNVNDLTLHEASYTHPVHSPTARVATAGSYRPANSATRQLPPLRPAVQNVIRALRAMPPDAGQRQIDSGRYNNLSPQELELVRYAAGLPSQREQPEEAPLQAK